MHVQVLLAQVEDPSSWLNYVERGGVLACVLLFAWLLYSRRLVTREEHLERLAEERGYTREWKELANGAIERIEFAVREGREGREKREAR